MGTLKQLGLFGDEEVIASLHVARQAKHETYEEFVAKFDKAARRYRESAGEAYGEVRSSTHRTPL